MGPRNLWVACAIAAAAALGSNQASADVTTETVDESTTTFTFDFSSLAPPGLSTEATLETSSSAMGLVTSRPRLSAISSNSTQGTFPWMCS